jgi:hypothetical protein
MTSRARRGLLLLALLGLLPACAAAPRIFPLDASGMEYPLHVFGAVVSDQADRTADRITGFPQAFLDHWNTSMRNLNGEPEYHPEVSPQQGGTNSPR